MENNKVIGIGEYTLPSVVVEQTKLILTDINHTKFEAVFFKPNTKQILQMEEASKDFQIVGEQLYAKDSQVKKTEWILDNLLSIPEKLKIEHLDKESAKELAKVF